MELIHELGIWHILKKKSNFCNKNFIKISKLLTSLLVIATIPIPKEDAKAKYIIFYARFDVGASSFTRTRYTDLKDIIFYLKAEGTF